MTVASTVSTLPLSVILLTTPASVMMTVTAILKTSATLMEYVRRSLVWLMLTVMMRPMERESVMFPPSPMEIVTIVTGANVNQVYNSIYIVHYNNFDEKDVSMMRMKE